MNAGPATFDVFFSYNTLDHLPVENLAARLREEGLTVFLDRWYLPKGIPWQEYLEGVLERCGSVAVFIGREGLGRWQQREKELALERQTKERMFPVIPVLLPEADPPLGFLSLNTWVDLRNGTGDRQGLAALSAAVRGLPPGPSAAPAASISPYRGLRYFREEDAPLFFGRDGLIAQLVEAVHQKTLVTVVGASGSGKSSVVRAGLVPRLRSASGEQVWEIVTMVPGDRPLVALVGALMPLIEPEMSDSDRLVQRDKLSPSVGSTTRLRDLVAMALEKQPGTDRLLLVVDQAEELYTAVKAEEVRQKFIDEILDASEAAPLTVVLTLRADFMNEILESSQLAQRVRDGIVYVTPMTPEELRQVVELPALRTGLSFEPGLAQGILEKVKGRPGDLPLLEFVLSQLWERRSRDGMLTHQAYETIGKVEGAIAAHANRVLAGFSADERATTRRIFLQLVRPAVPSAPGTGEERPKREYVRRRAAFGDLGAGVQPVIQKLADKHLIVTSRDEATGREIADLVHEALIEKWTTLREWIDADREFLDWREQLRTLQSFAVGEEVVPLTGHLLRESRRWQRERPEEFTDRERAYIKQSANARRNEISLRVAAPVIVMLAIGAGGYLTSKWLKPSAPSFPISATIGSATDTGSTTETTETTDTTATTTSDDDPRFEFSINRNGPRGIDLSGNNPDRWPKDISFGLIVARDDQVFKNRWKTAHDRGLIRGASHAFTSNGDPVAQAEQFVRMVRPGRDDLLGVNIGFIKAGESSPADSSRKLHRFLGRVEALTGKRCLIYVPTATHWNQNFDSSFGQYPLMLAGEPPAELPRGWSRVSMWVAPRTVDAFFLFMGTKDELLALARPKT